MNRRNSPEELLKSARSLGGPTARQADHVFLEVQRRLAAESAETDASQSVASVDRSRSGGGSANAIPRRGGRAGVAPRATTWPWLSPALRWLSVALTAGSIGYVWGRWEAESDHASSEPRPATVRPLHADPDLATFSAPPGPTGPARSEVGRESPGDPPMLPAPSPLAAQPSSPASPAEAQREPPHASRVPSAARKRPPAPPPDLEAPPAVDSSLSAALRLLRRAERGLRAGNAEVTLALLDQLDERFPASMLWEERRATRALALCRLGQQSAAQALARELLDHNRESIYRGRLEASCALPVPDPNRPVTGTPADPPRAPTRRGKKGGVPVRAEADETHTGHD